MRSEEKAVNATTIVLVEFTAPVSTTTGANALLSTLITTSATDDGLTTAQLSRLFKCVIAAVESNGNTNRDAIDWATVSDFATVQPAAEGAALTLNVLGAGLKKVWLRSQGAAATNCVAICYLRS